MINGLLAAWRVAAVWGQTKRTGTGVNLGWVKGMRMGSGPPSPVSGCCGDLIMDRFSKQCQPLSADISDDTQLATSLVY